MGPGSSDPVRSAYGDSVDAKVGQAIGAANGYAIRPKSQYSIRVAYRDAVGARVENAIRASDCDSICSADRYPSQRWNRAEQNDQRQCDGSTNCFECFARHQDQANATVGSDSGLFQAHPGEMPFSEKLRRWADSKRPS